MLRFDHFNFNVLDLERSLKFYSQALELKPVKEKNAADGSFRPGRRGERLPAGADLAAGPHGAL